MLFKLIKHNLKPILKSILPFAVALLASVSLFNVTGYEVYLKQELMEDGHYSYTDYIEVSELQQFLHGFFQFTIYCSLILIFAVAVRAIWYQFKTTFYSDRAYLTHTLPVARKTLWSAEICTVLVTYLGVVAVVVISCLILSLSKYGLIFLNQFGLVGGCAQCLGDYYNVHPLGFDFYLSFALVVFCEFVFITFCGISGMILKHRLGSNLSLATGLGIYLLGSIALLCLIQFISTFDKEISGVFGGAPIRTPGYDPDVNFMSRALFYIGSIYAVYCVALYFVDQKLLHRGINLD